MALEDIQSGLTIEEPQSSSDSVPNFNTLDFSNVDNSFDSFSGLNLSQISEYDRGLKAEEGSNITLTDETTRPPNTSKPSGNPLGEANEIIRRAQLTRKFFDQNLPAFAVKSAAPMQTMVKPYEFDTYKSNVERYEAYGKETFRDIGFNPLLSPDELEKNFNEKTAFWEDYKRMGGQFMSLAGTAFMGNYNSISNFFSGNSIIDPDEESDKAFSEANRIGMSSRGGFTGFANNLALNGAFSVGIAANVAAEEFAIWAGGLILAPETGGGSLAAAGALQTAEAASIASKVGRLKRGLSAAFGTSDLSKVATGGYGMLKSLAKAEDAKTFYQNLKLTGQGFVDFVNPLRQTTSTLKGISKGDAAYRNISNLAKMSRGFGSFYRDMRENWFTISEAQMEGGGVKKERIDDEISKYQKNNNGELPTGKVLDAIYINAETAGKVDVLGNIPLIFLTNRITFDGLFKFRGIGELIEGFEKSSLKGLRNKFVFDAGSKTIQKKIEEGFLKRAWGVVKSPKKIVAGGGLFYLKENLSEGIQELGQEWLAGATKNYYKDMYEDGQYNSSKLLKSSIYDGLVSSTTSRGSWQSVKDNIFSQQGLGTFASGFLMGGLIGGAQYSLTAGVNKIWNTSAEAYQKWNNPAAFEAYKKNKLEIEEKHLAIMNNMLSNPENFFNSKNETFYNQNRNVNDMEKANDAKDAIGFHDAKDKLTFDSVMESIEAGTFDVVLDSFKELEKLNDTELADYFNIKDSSKARDKITEYRERAESIKKRSEFFEENFPNPFNPKNFKKGSEEQIDEFISYKAYNDAKKAAIFSQHSFDRSLERMVNIYEDLVQNPPLKKINETDLSTILNPDTIPAEVKLLRQEAELLQQSPEKADKKLAKDKLKRAGVLEQYSEEYAKASEEKDYNKLSKVYKAYLKVIANERKDYLFDSSVDDSFGKVVDHYQLKNNSETYMANVNYLTNPNNLIRHTQRLRASLRELYNDRETIYKNGLNNFFKMADVNGFISALGKINIVIAPDQLVEYVKTGKVPNTFIDIKSGNEISNNDPRVATIQGMLDILTKLKTGVEKIDDLPVEIVQPKQKEKVVIEEPVVAIKEDVNSKLEEAYNKFVEETGSDISFDDFVATHPTAARIKSEGVSAAPAVQPTEASTAGTFTPTTPYGTPTGPEVVTATPVSDIEAKKADIERIRKEELNKIPNVRLPINAISAVRNKKKDVVTGKDWEDANQEEVNKLQKEYDEYVQQGVYTTKGMVFKHLNEAKEALSKVKEINAKYDAELAALEGKSTQAATPTINIEAEKKKLEEERDRKIEEEAPIQNFANIKLGFSTSDKNEYETLIEALNNIDDISRSYLKNLEELALRTVKAKEEDVFPKGKENNPGAYIGKYMKQNFPDIRAIFIDNEKAVSPTDPISVSRQFYLQSYKWAQMKLAGQTTRSLGEFLLDTQKEIRDEYQAKIAALEGTTFTGTPLTTRQQIAQEKINEVLDKVTVFRDAPSPNLNDTTSEASKELLNLVSSGEITSDEAEAAAKKKHDELLNKLESSDFIKGDVVIFTDGRKGIVTDVTDEALYMKMFDTPGAIEKILFSKVKGNVVSIKNTKQAIEDEGKKADVEVSKEDEDNMKKSQENTDDLATDSQRASDAINKGIDNASDQPPSFDDLFLGCDE